MFRLGELGTRTWHNPGRNLPMKMIHLGNELLLELCILVPVIGSVLLTFWLLSWGPRAIIDWL